MIRFIIITILFSLTLQSKAQMKLSIKAPDSLAFILTLNNEVVNNIACVAIVLDNIEAGKTSVSFNFPAKSSLNFNQIITTKKNSTSFYEITSAKGALKLSLISETLGTPAVPKKENPISPTAPLTVANTPPAGETINSETDSASVSSYEFDRLISDLQGILFEGKKLDKIKSFYASRSLNVDQLRYLMTQLSMEENKLDLLRELKSKVTDKSRLPSVRDEFFLDKNKEKAMYLIAD